MIKNKVKNESNKRLTIFEFGYYYAFEIHFIRPYLKH